MAGRYRGAAQERPLLSMGSLNYKLAWGSHAGCSAAITITPNKSQDDQYLPEWLWSEGFASQDVYFSSLSVFFFLFSIPSPCPVHQIIWVDHQFSLSQKIFTWRVYFANTRNYKHGTEMRQIAVPMHSFTDFLKACVGPKGRQQMKSTGIQTDPWLLLQWSIQDYKAVC